MKSPLKGSNGGVTFWFKICGWPRNVILLENPQFLHLFGPFFFKFIRKTWENQFRGVRVLWTHSGATKPEKRSKKFIFDPFLIAFPVLSLELCSKYSYAPESVCPRFSDEFDKKIN